MMRTTPRNPPYEELDRRVQSIYNAVGPKNGKVDTPAEFRRMVEKATGIRRAFGINYGQYTPEQQQSLYIRLTLFDKILEDELRIATFKQEEGLHKKGKRWL